MEALHAEADVILRHRQRHLRLASTHQDIWGPHLLHTTLLRISLTSFKKWKPTSGSLNRNVRNYLLATLLAPSVTPERRGRNERLGSEATLVRFNYRSSMYIHHRCFKCTICKNAKNNSKHTSVRYSEQAQHSQQKPKRYWRPVQ